MFERLDGRRLERGAYKVNVKTELDAQMKLADVRVETLIGRLGAEQ